MSANPPAASPVDRLSHSSASLSVLTCPLPQLARLGYMYAMGFAARCKYYFVWKWAEGSLDAGLLGFSGFSADGTASWERGKNVRPPHA